MSDGCLCEGCDRKISEAQAIEISQAATIWAG